jgi:hypothetical protein
MKRSILVFALFAGFTVSAFGQSGNGLVVVVNAGKITITGYNGDAKVVVIPAEASGMPVVAIGERAFLNNRLTSVTLPDSVKTIERGAFALNQLTSVTVGANVDIRSDSLPPSFKRRLRQGRQGNLYAGRRQRQNVGQGHHVYLLGAAGAVNN